MRINSEYGKTRYYDSETTSDFCDTKTNKVVTVDNNYKYINENVFFKFFSFLLYYVIAIPIVWLIGKTAKGVKISGKKNVRKLKCGYIMYGNHTQPTDAFLGHVIANPKRTFIIANKDAISIKGIAGIVKMLGALPVPDTIGGLKHLNEAIKIKLQEKAALMVYPEAHIWGYYTAVRPFPVTSFKFAAEFNAPAVPVAVTYRLSKLFGKRIKPRVCVTIGAPIYPDKDKTKAQNAEMMRDYCYNFIKDQTSKEGNVALYNYVLRETNAE